MLFEAYYKAGSTLEEVAAIKEIGKLNGLYESDKQKGSTTTVNVVGQVNNVKQLERMSENQLLNLAKDLESDLEPEIVERPKLPPAEEIEDAVYEESGSDVPAMLIENTRRNKDAAGAIKRIEESRENEADQIGTQDGVGGDVGDAGSGIAPTGVPDFVAAAGNSNQYPGQSPYYDLDDFGGEVQTGSRPRNTENGTDE